MESIEIQATTVDAATKSAAEKLGVDAKRLKVTVLEEVKGLFGKASVRIRAEVKPEAASKAKPKAAKKEPAPPEVKEVVPEPKAKPSRATKTKAAPAQGKTAGDENTDEEDRPEAVATKEDAKLAAKIVDDILELADLQGEITTTSFNGRYVNLELDGKDVAYLVGKHGEVLNAFQYLVNVMMARKLGNGVRVTLDGNHYRQRREEALSQLANQIAEQVIERGEEAVLDALPAFERRVVHKALQDVDGVQTYSEGEEPNRRVVIAPG